MPRLIPLIELSQLILSVRLKQRNKETRHTSPNEKSVCDFAYLRAMISVIGKIKKDSDDRTTKRKGRMNGRFVEKLTPHGTGGVERVTHGRIESANQQWKEADVHQVSLLVNTRVEMRLSFTSLDCEDNLRWTLIV